MLPGESQAIEEVIEECGPLLAFARRILRNGLEMPIRPFRRELPRRTYLNASGLYIKACKQLRAIIALCELAAHSEAEILLRGLLETAFAMEFHLRHKFVRYRLSQKNVNGKIVPTRRRADPPGTALPEGLRADLYIAHQYFDQEKDIGRLERTPRVKKSARGVRAKWDSAEVAAQARHIGPYWTKELKDRGYYSGLSVADLALSLGSDFQLLHALMYGPQSKRAHATEISEHFQVNPDPQRLSANWHAMPREIAWTLHLACTTYLQCLLSYNKRLQFGVAVDHLLRSFKKQINQLAPLAITWPPSKAKNTTAK